MKVSTWNMENFFIFLDNYKKEDLNEINNNTWESFSNSTVHNNKHLQKVLQSEEVITDIDADIYILTEIGGYESLNNFNNYFLNNQYNIYINPSNSRRGIDVGFLVNKRLNYNIELIINKFSHDQFARGISELRLLKNDSLKYIFLGVHLKSKLSKKDDFQGIKQRSKELINLKSHINKLDHLNIPIIIGGDFNCTLQEPELKKFSKGLKELHTMKKSTIEESHTHVFFSYRRVLNQLDYLFTNKKTKINLDKSYTYRFKNEYGDVLGIPENMNEKKWNPSDHYPLIIEID